MQATTFTPTTSSIMQLNNMHFSYNVVHSTAILYYICSLDSATNVRRGRPLCHGPPLRP